MDTIAASQSFAALSQPMRVDVLRLLVRAGPEGMPAGAIGEALGVRQNTMSANLSTLASAGLIAAARDGRRVIYSADMEGIRGLIAFLMEDCCGGRPEACRPILDALTCEGT